LGRTGSTPHLVTAAPLSSRLRRLPARLVLVAVTAALLVGGALRPAGAQTRVLHLGDGTVTLRGGYGSIAYFENFDGVVNGVTIHAHGGTSAPAYDLGMTFEQPLSDPWSVAVVADWIATGLIQEPYTLHEDNFPSGGTTTLDQSNQQRQSLSLLNGDLRIAYQLRPSDLSLFVLGGYRSASTVYSGGTFTATTCTGSPPSCSNSAGGLTGGTETFQSVALGAGAKLRWTAGLWTGALEAHYAALPSISIANNFAVPGQVTTLTTSGTEWGLGLTGERALSAAWSLTLGVGATWTNIAGTPTSAATFFPGGGWAAYNASVGATYWFER